VPEQEASRSYMTQMGCVDLGAFCIPELVTGSPLIAGQPSDQLLSSDKRILRYGIT
jgi:hypothetical protein